jgi:hypothetical protein
VYYYLRCTCGVVLFYSEARQYFYVVRTVLSLRYQCSGQPTFWHFARCTVQCRHLVNGVYDGYVDVVNPAWTSQLSESGHEIPNRILVNSAASAGHRGGKNGTSSYFGVSKSRHSPVLKRSISANQRRSHEDRGPFQHLSSTTSLSVLSHF